MFLCNVILYSNLTVLFSEEVHCTCVVASVFFIRSHPSAEARSVAMR